MTGDQLVLPQQLQLNYSTYFSPGRKNRFLASTQSPGRSRHAVLIIFSSIPVFFSQTAPHVNNNTQFSYIWTSLLVNKNQACILVLVFTLYHLTYFNLVMEMSPGLREAWKDVNSYKFCLLIRKLYPRQRKFNFFKQPSIVYELISNLSMDLLCQDSENSLAVLRFPR